jgi:hypothetical protein
VTLPPRPCLLLAGPVGGEAPPGAATQLVAELLGAELLGAELLGAEPLPGPGGHEVRASAGGHEVRAGAGGDAVRTGAGGEAVLAGVRGGRVVAVLPAGTRGIEAALAVRGWRGCAVDGSPLAEVTRAYRLAAGALDLAPAHAFEGRAVLSAGDAQVVALLAARPVARPAAVVTDVLGGLVEPGAAHLLDGLAAFLGTGSATAAAASLGLHPQTLRYRLRRVTALTGRDPRRPWDRLVLDVARTLAGFHQG